MEFVNRSEELGALDRFWESPGAGMGIVWGRRRVGKTLLLSEFARDRRGVFHTATSRPAADELSAFSRVAADAGLLSDSFRDLAARPFADWQDALETLAAAARDSPLLLVIDEFPALVETNPELPSVLRAVWDRLREQTRLKVLLCGSAVRVMEAAQEERAPLYGRFDLSLQLHPFEPWEAALMLPKLSPSERALVWGVVGGMPLYLSWWDQEADIERNVGRLFCEPGAPLLNEGRLVLATEADAGDLARQALYAVASGRSRFNEIEQAIQADPTRVLERLVALRLLRRYHPVTETGTRTRRRIYRLADNFLAFWLGMVDRHRAEIERGLGSTIAPVLVAGLSDHLGHPYEEAFRMHLRRMAAAGELGPEIVAVGPWWDAAKEPVEIDAVALSGRSRRPVLVGECKWARSVDALRLAPRLAAKAESVPDLSPDRRIVICARDAVTNAKQAGVMPLTAADIFSP